jgi:hypothetical protein
MSDLATAIKESNYVVWTRLNCVYVDLEARIADNEKMRLNYGTNIDFVGVDSYRHHFNSDQSYIESMRTNIPYKNKNYRMIMEIGAEVSNIAQLQLAALSGNNAFDYYDMCGPDGHGLYDKKDVDRFVPHGEYIGDVRLVNKILNSDIVDIALNANGHGLFVHNWEGIKTVPTKGVKGIIFMPAYPTSQGISISRSDSELVLMSTKGGTFILPDSLHINGANRGYFDKNNKWVKEGSVPVLDHSVSIGSGCTIRVMLPDIEKQKPIIKQAEFAKFGAAVAIGFKHIGFSGNGYLRFPLAGGYVQWDDIDGRGGRGQVIRFRYANGSNQSKEACLFINDIPQIISFLPTGSWENYQYTEVKVTLNKGNGNIVRIESIGNGTGNIDELQIL